MLANGMAAEMGMNFEKNTFLSIDEKLSISYERLPESLTVEDRYQEPHQENEATEDVRLMARNGIPRPRIVCIERS